jgi:thimet oligopeptidase
LRHTGVVAYRCSLPGLAGFTAFRCARPNPRLGVAYGTTRMTPGAFREAPTMPKFRPLLPPLASVSAILLLAAMGARPALSAPPISPQEKLLAAGALTPAAIAQSCAAQIALTRQRIDAIVHRRSARTFQTVFEALENVESDIGDNLGAATFLYEVSPDAAVRAASEKCSTDVSDLFNQETARPDLYAALAAARASHTAKTPADLKLQELDLIAAQRAGAALPPAQRKTFLALEAQLSGESLAFADNLQNDKSSITITPAQAAVLPPDFTGTLKTDAAGNTIVPVNESTVGTFMTSETDGSARKAFDVTYSRRGGEANVVLLQRAIIARDAVARLLHFPNWAAYIAADRVAGSTARIATFLHDIDVALLPKAREERAQLAAAKGSALDQWDVSFYQNQLRKSRYSVDRDVVKTYFPAPHVIAAVLHIYSELLGLTFTPAPELPVWDPAVTAYDVTDTETGVYRGSFYLDLYPRPGKFNHFENAGITARRTLPDGTVRPAINTILGNWPAPAPGKPALLSHDDVITFFHEFGHNVAALCADTPYETLNNGFRWDFVEAPSQMLENFVWDPAILKEISSNVDTGAPLPDDLIGKIIAARYFDESTFEVGQAFLSTVDQLYHTLPPPVDTTAVWKRTLTAMTPSVFLDGTIPQASFNHLMNGYEAQYYGYLWSKVYAQDMFTAFQKGGLENPAVGARYRKDILAPARMIEPDAEVRAFLGRPMDPSTFYRQLGITKTP